MIRINTEALRVVGMFFVFGLFWILFTTGFYSRIASSNHEIVKFEIYKGLLFITLSSLVIYLIVRREILKKQIYESNLEIEKNKYKTLFETTNDAIIIVDEENRISDCNAKSLELFKCSKAEILNKMPSELSPEFQYDDMKSYELMEIRMNTARNGKPLKFDWIHNDLNKTSSIYTEVTLNKIIFNGKRNVFAVIRDITEEMKILQRIKESEEKYRLLVENSPSVFWVCDKNGTALYTSPNVYKIIGYTPEEIYDERYKIWIDRIHPKDIENVASNFRSVFTENKKCDVTYRIKNKNEKWVWVNTIEEKSLNNEGQEVVYGVSTDITEKKYAQQKILYAMINAEERERSRISKDLHDGVSPILSTLNLFVESMSDSKNEKIKKELSIKIKETIKEAVESINEISYNISPHILQNFGLLEAVESFINRISDYNKVKINIDSKIKGRFSEIVETAFYRITIELINNTLKYANAKNIFINYDVKSEMYNMRYEDDGIGFDVDEVLEKKKGMGIFNINNRINSMHGYVEIKNKPKGGLHVEISVPVDN